jgi:hypothetical protein
MGVSFLIVYGQADKKLAPLGGFYADQRTMACARERM